MYRVFLTKEKEENDVLLHAMWLYTYMDLYQQ
jgi:hypothetical protein